MKRIVNVVSLMFFASTAILAGCMGGVGTVAVASAVIYYEAKKTHDIAEVELNAKPEAVYRTALDVARKNPRVTILEQDDKKMTMEFQKGGRNGTLKIKQKEEGKTLLIIQSKKAKEGEEKILDPALEAVKRICDEMNVQYKVVHK
jgi:hypothetical protein